MPESESANTALTKATSETLSQLLARILDQLSLSAWLPSAALTLSLAFVFQLGSVLGMVRTPAKKGVEAVTYAQRPGDAVTKAFSELGHTSFGGLMLVVSAVIVLTMITQAFSFEAIRVLEGYWGTWKFVEDLAQRRCHHFRRIQNEKLDSLDSLTTDAWTAAKQQLPDDFTADMVQALGVPVIGGSPVKTLTPAQQRRVAATDWKVFSEPDLLRRRVNLQTRLSDFPPELDILPTKLGNVLHHFENLTGRTSVEGLVDEVFDSLPLTLQRTHDQQRARLDLYCSMVFVVPLVMLIATGRFGFQYWPYAVAALVLGMVGTPLFYRAALASARHYGGLLPAIAAYAQPVRARPRSIRVIYGVMRRLQLRTRSI